MRYLKFTLLTLLASLFIGISPAHSFSFDWGDGDDYFHPYWGSPYFRTWNPYYFTPQLNYFDRSAMVRERQEVMGNHYDTMTRLADLLYGKYGFDRAEAIQLARKIELTSGAALTNNFHPGAVRSFDSRTTPAFWGNEKTFRANAQALQAAAGDLADELAKTPTEAEGAVFLNRSRGRYGDEEQREALSPAVWEKFNTMSNICESCHRSFRGPRW